MDTAATRAFAHALRDPDTPTPSGLVTWNGSDAAGRFAIYRNNVAASLTAALAVGFPVTRALVGEEFFGAMARFFVLAHPPRMPVLAAYGGGFPDFIAGFPPASGLPYLADVARLEAARVRAHHAADAVALGPDDFAAIDGPALASQVLAVHPSAAILSSRHAILSLWAAHQGLLDIADVDPDDPEDVLVIRPGLEVHVVGLGPGQALFLDRLAQGDPFAGAAEQAAASPGFDLVAALRLVITTGFACAASPSVGALR